MAGGEDEWEEIALPEEEWQPEDERLAGSEARAEMAAREESAPAVPTITDRSRFAMASGLGIFLLGLAIYFFVVLPGDVTVAGFSAAGMALAISAVYFWMAADLRFRPRTLSRYVSRFIAGPLLGLLALLGFFTFTAFLGPAAAPGSWVKAATIFLLEFGTAATAGLFFYSMLWEG